MKTVFHLPNEREDAPLSATSIKVGRRGSTRELHQGKPCPYDSSSQTRTQAPLRTANCDFGLGSLENSNWNSIADDREEEEPFTRSSEANSLLSHIAQAYPNH